ncbi:hypothetical protein AOC36_11480 [Erysipelothrix larvae]|uniref:Cyclodeaminase/cyclohydrolase domain-containing protein n=1 Tax=Erysipelothrix larvae TaxID=1514105 RepID=A0A0X8H1X1_9FIRM|nr:cyclodeaminase/cyclohydrolase family protein [Erysipelothrix larvae]AMC94570.1 hypothetical protein AOC36_11480 [Erysipelothrix larvae]
MKLVDLTLKDFTSELASSSPAPGGGSAAALSGSIGVSLVSMVGTLTLGSKKYAQHHDATQGLIDQADASRLEFLRIVDADTESFNIVSDAFKLPKETPEDKAARSVAIQAGLKQCTLTPYQILEQALVGMKLIEAMLEGFNTSASSDLGVAALHLHTAAYGGWYNILINLSSIKDQAFVDDYTTKGTYLLETIDTLHQQILDKVASYL